MPNVFMSGSKCLSIKAALSGSILLGDRLALEQILMERLKQRLQEMGVTNIAEQVRHVDKI